MFVVQLAYLAFFSIALPDSMLGVAWPSMRLSFDQLCPLPADCILVDLASVKAEPLQAMLAAHKGPVLGLHPMFGPDSGSLAKQVVVYCDGRQPFAGVLFFAAMRVFLLQNLDLLRQQFNLCKEQRVGENRPAVDEQGCWLAAAHSASADKEA